MGISDTTSQTPVVFLGHGSPMNTLEDNRYTRTWRELGQSLPRPRAILTISAHWFMGATAVTGMSKPRTIHDFFGFGAKLSNFDYPAAGAPDVAKEVIEMCKPRWVGFDDDSWGLDHGTWSVLAHVFPKADIPVIQLSINATKPMDYHLDLAARLAPLRKKGVLILGSGNVVHNLRRLNFSQPDHGFDWAHRFDDAAAELMTEAPGNILNLLGHPDYDLAVPVTDHFIPLLYVAALGAADGKKAASFARGYVAGSLSMSCYAFDAKCPTAARADEAGAAALPDPAVVPPDDTNA
ncbi:MAG: 4,5-DOPA dioxygenase extradiol [Deltaproteobacteria bacterium]|nr:4,5-DOPA dioxygenase extradiol [Deltaproteobacteria bacterium]